MVPRENKNNAYAKFGGTNKEYYGIFRIGLFQVSFANFGHNKKGFIFGSSFGREMAQKPFPA